ncbi:MAG: 16S rRNA (guanine(966)-N(2))-methyltransferase RsmD [Armatimonadota bacterium]|nr:16S rRNA (guanine(966)-N(2))-methyltransferase RsmD [Armatimonadota bacterium]MDR7570480.1 16S rRNA (guanine(966)-N(2))-methyltransferase RsmD [Armatimonadota bacterium]MDR7614328.1 16S rRNA (guanine(966)-N(2))-methyltransferase RsmD [Armatimonadota bacterium]
MRIGAGTSRGRRIRVPPGVRPTQERARSAIFNMLGERVRQARVLDLFAGAGTLGLEALSRGARWAVFVERAPRAVRTLRANLAEGGWEDQGEVWPMDVFRALVSLGRRGHRFDLVFLDPPYGTGLVERTLEALATSGLLAPGAAVVAESAVREAVQIPAGYEVVRDRRYGDTRVRILIWRGT